MSAETRFTPGPWRAVDHNGEGWWSVLNGAWDVSHNSASRPGVVTDAKYSAMTPAENEANAHLIAAAPDLYAALAALVDYTEQLEIVAYPEVEREVEHKVMRLARRALAAARGETEGA